MENEDKIPRNRRCGRHCSGETRGELGLTQAQLATKAGVGRRFIVDLEAGHDRAELPKVLSVLDALDIHAPVLPPATKRTRMEDVDLDQVLRDY